MFRIVILLIIGSYCATNLVQDGDFEAYASLINPPYINVVNGITISLNWTRIPSNLSCWYDQAMSFV